MSRMSRVGMGGMLTALALTLVAFVPVASAQVNVTVAVSGDAVPGGTVTATATVDLADGSTLQGIEWSQVGGAAASLSGTTTDTVTVGLPGADAFREHLIAVLEEPPIGPDQLPPNVPPPPADEEFVGGLQNRFVVVGINNLALEEAGAIELQAKVTTSSGIYYGDGTVAVTLPWPTATGNRNVPIDVPVILHGKTQASYDWALTAPAGSAAALVGATTQDPEFTPDVIGQYTVTVTDADAGSAVTLQIAAGTWHGVIVGQDADGYPEIDSACTGCHAPGTALDYFTPWKQSGHASIFSYNLNTSTHYGESCLACHTVGYNTDADNNGFDDQSDYQAFIDSGMLHDAQPDNWTNMLAQFPKTAKLANIQCENCHGPQNSPAHMTGQGQRASLSSDLCGSCHGEPARHGRYQQWQLSGHANYELAGEEGTNSNCARCHSGNGFIQWVKDFDADPNANVNVTWTADEVHPQTCQACHDPHHEGYRSNGTPYGDGLVRITGTTPELVAGFVATDVGKGAICMTCHNSRRGLRNDDTFDVADAARATHPGPQADVLMGQNAYFVQVGTRSYHSYVQDACVACHMEKTPPPADLSYNLGGTNHTFYASPTICEKCHSVIRAEDVQGPVEAKLVALKSEIEAAILRVMATATAAGDSIDLGGNLTVTDASQIARLDLQDYHGGQAIAVYMVGGTVVGPVGMSSVKVVGTDATTPIYTYGPPAIAKAGWNYFLFEADGSLGVHNPGFANSALGISLYAASTAEGGQGTNGGGSGGNTGTGAGAVACTTPYVYWTEIVTHDGGAGGSQWRTDMVARNMASSTANLEFILHAASGDVHATSTVPAGAQGVYEDLVQMMGVNDKGSLELCSDQPLEVVSRIFNQGEKGTFGQFADGYPDSSGMSVGQSARLLGLRQMNGAFRTNISVTNGGKTEAKAQITLFDTDGNELDSYELSVGPGMVVQDLEPFKTRAGAANLGWGFATVTIKAGTNVLTSASVIDMSTNDATTIPAKR